MGKKGKKLKIFSALEVANLCGVVNQTAINWIKNGYLKAFTTPGGQYRVYAENLIEFIENRGMILPEELIPYKSIKSSSVRIIIIDSDSLFGDILSEKAVLEKKQYDITVADDSFTSGYMCAKKKPEVIIMKMSCEYTNPEKLKNFFESVKTVKPLIISVADVDKGPGGGFSDIIMNYPVDFNIMFDYIDKNTGINRNGLKK